MKRGKRDAKPFAGGGGSGRARALKGEPPEDEQRERIIVAAERLLDEFGPAHLNVEPLRAATGLSRAALKAVVGDAEDLQLALFDRLASRLGTAMSEAYRGKAVWVDGIRAALFELLAFLDARPQAARFLLVSSLQGDSAILA